MIIESAETELQKLFGLSAEQVQRVLDTATRGEQGKKQGVFCDIYFQAGTAQGLTFDQGVLKNTSSSTTSGAGVRVVVGDKTGYSHTGHVNVTNLLQCAKVARAITEHASGSANVGLDATNSSGQHNLYPILNSPVDIALQEKIDLLRKIDKEVRLYDQRIQNVTVSIACESYTIIIVNSLEQIFVDLRPLVRISVSCLAEENGRKETGSSGGGGRYEFSVLAEDNMWQEHAHIAAKMAIDLLASTPAPAGVMDVVLGSGWPGVLIHEAVGHGLEGDFNRMGTSAFSSLMGEAVASPLVTVIDDGTMQDRRGSLNFDDEGTATGRTVLIENGVLKNYLQDKKNAGLMKSGVTGNGRRQDYRYAPIPRMTNTYMAGGESTPEEIIASVKYGLYAANFGGGQVDITNGNFTFSAVGAYLIENGKVTRTVKGATLIGNGPKALHNVTMVGNDLSLDRGIGTCGKAGQGVPVGVGMPTIRINGVTVGGSQ
ncbi:MAG: metalloprotease TldD [Candidatus Obscuribacterales bacterium]|jgi:TldD protein